MEDCTDIRERVGSGKVSKRAILRETGMHWKTLKKILTHSEPPGYRLRKARPQQKLGPYQERIEQILKEDQLLPRKQRHTAKRIWEPPGMVANGAFAWILLSLPPPMVER